MAGDGTILCMAQITKREAADMLSVTPSAVQRMIDRGELRPVKTLTSNGRVVLYMFNARDVERLASRRAAA